MKKLLLLYILLYSNILYSAVLPSVGDYSPDSTGTSCKLLNRVVYSSRVGFWYLNTADCVSKPEYDYWSNNEHNYVLNFWSNNGGLCYYDMNILVYDTANSKTCTVGDLNLTTCNCDMPPPPTCNNNEVLNDTNTSCVYPSLLTTSYAHKDDGTEDTDTVMYEYSGGMTQVCSNSDGYCATFANDGSRIDNIPIDGITYDTVIDGVYQDILNVGLATLAVAGAGIAIVSTGGLAVGLGSALSVHSGIAYTGSKLFNKTLYSIDDYSSSSSSTSFSNAIKVSLDDYTTESSEVSKSVDTSGNTVSTVTALDGTKQNITFTPTDIISELITPTGQKQITTIPKTVFNNPSTDFTSQSTKSDISYTNKIIEPTIINNDGTLKNGATTTTVNTYSPSTQTTLTQSSTNTLASTSSSAVGSASTATSTATSTTNATTGETTTTTTQDNTDINSRLDQIINQNSKNNLDTQNTLTKITSIDNNIQGIKEVNRNGFVGISSRLDGIQNTLNATNDSLVPSFTDVEAQYTLFSDRLTRTYKDTLSKVDTLKMTLQGGFKNSLVSFTVTNCPIQKNIDFVFTNIPLDIDICKVISPVSDATYFLFYVMFFASFLSMSFKILSKSEL